MPTYKDFAPLYDFSLIEKAVQQFFVVKADEVFVQPPDDTNPTRELWTPGKGNVAFFTTFQNQVFQKARPRVSVLLNGVAPWGLRRIVDANDQMQTDWWKGRLTFQVITAPDYAYHMTLRATVLALIAQLAPPSGDAVDFPIGVNNYLDLHEVTGIEPQDISTGIHLEAGDYMSPINCNIDFAVKPDAWPGGTK